jgi:hypothetical protein
MCGKIIVNEKNKTENKYKSLLATKYWVSRPTVDKRITMIRQSEKYPTKALKTFVNGYNLWKLQRTLNYIMVYQCLYKCYYEDSLHQKV